MQEGKNEGKKEKNKKMCRKVWVDWVKRRKQGYTNVFVAYRNDTKQKWMQRERRCKSAKWEKLE